MRKALSWPARQIALNAGEDGSVVVGKILDKDQYNFGFDAQNGEYGNMVKQGHHRPDQGGARRAAGRGIRRRPARSPPKPWWPSCREAGRGPAMPGGGMDF